LRRLPHLAAHQHGGGTTEAPGLREVEAENVQLHRAQPLGAAGLCGTSEGESRHGDVLSGRGGRDGLVLEVRVQHRQVGHRQRVTVE